MLVKALTFHNFEVLGQIQEQFQVIDEICFQIRDIEFEIDEIEDNRALKSLIRKARKLGAIYLIHVGDPD